MNELIPLQNADPVVLFAPGGLDPIIEAIEREARALVPDISTATGRKAVASNAAKVAKAKTYLDDIGKSYVAELKELPKKIDAARKTMRDRLDALKDEVRAPLTEYEAAQKRIEDAINAAIANFRLEPEHNAPSDEIEARLKWLEAFDMDSIEWMGRLDEAVETRDHMIVLLRERLEARQRYDQIVEQNKQLERQKAELERLERERQIAEQAAARSRAETIKELRIASIEQVVQETCETVPEGPGKDVLLEMLNEPEFEPDDRPPQTEPAHAPRDEPIEALPYPNPSMDRLDALDDLCDLFGDDIAEQILAAIESGKVSNVSASWV